MAGTLRGFASHSAPASAIEVALGRQEARELVAAQSLQGAAADEVFFRRRQKNSLTVLADFKACH